MDINITLHIIELLMVPVVGFFSWLGGTRSRRNSVYQEMLATIKTLTEQNNELHDTVLKLQDDLIEVRRENAELKAGQEKMTRQMQELKAENAELKQLLTKKKK